MSKVKFQNYSGIKNEQHTPRAVAQSDFKNGYVVVRGFDATGKETATVPTTDALAKGELWFVDNLMDTPELDNYDDFVVKSGKPARLFNFENAKQEILEVSGDLVTGSLVVGDVMIADITAGKQGMYKKVTTETGYKVALKITGLNNIGGKGYDVAVTSI